MWTRQWLECFPPESVPLLLPGRPLRPTVDKDIDSVGKADPILQVAVE